MYGEMKNLCRIRDIQHAIAAYETAFERQFGVCLNEGMTLCSLDGGGKLSSGRLGELLGLSPSNTSKVLRSVEAKGYVAREVSPEDRRQMLFSITPAGRALVQTLHCEEQGMADLLREIGG